VTSIDLLLRTVGRLFRGLACRQRTGAKLDELLADQFFAGTVPLAHDSTGRRNDLGLWQADGEHFDIRDLECLRHLGNNTRRNGHIHPPEPVRPPTVAAKHEYNVDG